MAQANQTQIATRRPWYRPSLTTQILIGLVIGGVLGYVSPRWGNNVYFLRDIFLNLIKSIIAPLIFATLVVGIEPGVAGLPATLDKPAPADRGVNAWVCRGVTCLPPITDLAELE